MQAAGVSLSDYQSRIKTNADVAREIGAEVRFHRSPVAAWFAIMDRAVVASKPVAIHHAVSTDVSSSPDRANHFSNLFDTLWLSASANLTGIAEISEKTTLPKQSPGIRKRVFLCHASEDKLPVRNIYAELVHAGFAPWLDRVDLIPGQDWEREIRMAIKSAGAIVIFVSKNVSKSGYLQKELRVALEVAAEQPEGAIFVIPARLENCTVPESLNRWQYADLFEPDGFQKLVRALRLCLPE